MVKGSMVPSSNSKTGHLQPNHILIRRALYDNQWLLALHYQMCSFILDL